MMTQGAIARAHVHPRNSNQTILKKSIIGKEKYEVVLVSCSWTSGSGFGSEFLPFAFHSMPSSHL
jgi:hypothetical protein